MNAYRCAPSTSISTVSPNGGEVVIAFDRDGTFQTDDLGLIVILDALAADPNNPVESGGAARKPAPSKEITPEEESE